MERQRIVECDGFHRVTGIASRLSESPARPSRSACAPWPTPGRSGDLISAVPLEDLLPQQRYLNARAARLADG